MLETLHLKNVGPAPEMKLEFGSRLNVITGDNGLGKSFILDVAWWALTGDWLQKVNPRMLNGQQVRPEKLAKNAKIEFSINSSPIRGDNRIHSFEFVYNFFEQQWSEVHLPIVASKPRLESIVIYACSNSEFGVFDSIRGTFGFSSSELWNGLKQSVEIIFERILCNGLIRDWSQWLLEKGNSLKQLQKALEVLSPNEQEKLIVAKTTRVSIDDVRDIPTLKTPYSQEIPVIHASSGIKKIISLAYLLVWAWQEHLRVAELRQIKPHKKILFLVDEVENHLHPRWQRAIVQALMDVAKALSSELEVQIILTTHSPLVMASLEPFFDPEKDAWFDLNLINNQVTLEKMNFVRRGGAEMWLLSDAFDLQSTGSLQREQAIEEAARAVENPKLTKKKFLELDKKLRASLPETDEYWLNWRFYGEKKGWL